MLTVETLMTINPETVPVDMPLSALERRFLSSGVTGFPVLKGDQLVGVISRSDVVRSLLTERSRAEPISEFYSTTRSVRADEIEKSLEAIATQAGVRLAASRVEDVMSTNVVSVDRAQSISQVAEFMIEGHIHRLPVVDRGRLVGLVTSMDFVRAVAEGRLTESPDATVAQPLLEGGRT